jgi:Conserved region in glutamate synthase
MVRVTVGGPDCAKSNSASVSNPRRCIFGSLGANAIRAINKGAVLSSFAHDTGEGGFSVHHAEFGGDIIWEIGSGRFAQPSAGNSRRNASPRPPQTSKAK